MIGDPILYVARSGNKEDNVKPELRSGTVSKVVNYSPTRVVINAIVLMDGPSDNQPGFEAFPMQGFNVWCENIEFDTEKTSSQGTWTFDDRDQILTISEIEIIAPISHGRETIRRGPSVSATISTTP